MLLLFVSMANIEGVSLLTFYKTGVIRLVQVCQNRPRKQTKQNGCRGKSTSFFRSRTKYAYVHTTRILREAGATGCVCGFLKKKVKPSLSSAERDNHDHRLSSLGHQLETRACVKVGRKEGEAKL
jgi:hypothetical protein